MIKIESWLRRSLNQLSWKNYSSNAEDTWQQRKTIKLNRWLRKGIDSKVPEFVTHPVGVGAPCTDSLGSYRKRSYGRDSDSNKIPRYIKILHSHGLANGRSDLVFLCQLDPIAKSREDGSAVIQDPAPQECEIADAKLIPLSEYRAMVEGVDGHPGHPFLKEVLRIYDKGLSISHRRMKSVIPGKKPSPIYHAAMPQGNN